ncbi:SH3 domain-containing protein [Streptomyces agglomeratus]|uniref:SH3 domain-containing protein n=1 Tax=Streptomyces agglomeratus TaxID=285458 RepID=UPI000A63EB71|nr:SH3 domain-containing protein [Streptomyces agglomeratus]
MAVGEVEDNVESAVGEAAGTGASGTADAPDTVATLTTAETLATRYSVAPGYRVNVRSGPGTQYGIVKVLPYGARVPINCQCPGTTVSGPYGTTNLWSNIANGQFVSDAYINTGSDGYVAVRCSV